MYHVRCIDVVNKTKSTTGENKWLLTMILLHQFKCVTNVWGRMWDALKETIFCLSFQWLFDDGSERPDNCASWHPCHTNECYIECSAILRILLRCSCYSHTRYTAIFCTVTGFSSFLQWRLLIGKTLPSIYLILFY